MPVEIISTCQLKPICLTAIPAVNVNTATALSESSVVGISRGLPPQAVSLQVGVERGVDEVV